MSNPLDLLSPVWSHMTQIQPVRAEGIYFFDGDGRRYTDFTSGIGVTNTGHCHPRVVRAIQEQAATLIFGQMNIVVPPTALRLAELLNEVTPAGIDQFFISNSGAEAIEAAVKLARMATQRKNVVVMQGSFHGRTHLTMAMTTSKYIYRYQYQPLPAGVFVAPFPYAYHFGWSEEETVDFCLKQLDYLLKSQTAPDETAAIVIEPVLGEGGYVPAPDEFMRRLRALCSEYGILLVADEVQTGFGRTGQFFACEHSAVEPDILVMAKGLGSGMPISAIGARAELMAHWKPGTHGGTYGGGTAVASAAAIATIETIREERLVENAAAMGRAADGRPARDPGGISRHRRRARARADGGHRVHRPRRQAGRRGDQPGAEGMPEPRPAAADLRHLRQRHPLDPAPGGRRGADRRGAGHFQRGAGRGDELTD